ncbi:MAG: glycosyltransferase [bacterium]
MSSARRIDQVMAGFADGDAISHVALIMREVFRKWGMASDIYADARHVSSSMKDACRPLDQYRGAASDVVLHQYSIGSPALDAFVGSPAKKVLVYQNITPAEYFDGFDDRVAAQLRQARSLLKDISSRVDAAWATSGFNAEELRAVGVKNVRVFPLVFSPRQLDLPPDPEVLRKFATRLTTILYVGRIAPNKRIETLIEAFSWYYRKFNPYSRLVLVGSDRSCPRYFAMLRMQVGDLDLPNVCFEGFASPAGLPAYYRSSDLFVTTSEHEGYCLPLVEAMYMGVPVIAPHIGGMPEALGGAGVMVEDLKPAELAGLMDVVIRDGAVREDVLTSQRKRMEEIKRRDVEEELRQLLKEL